MDDRTLEQQWLQTQKASVPLWEQICSTPRHMLTPDAVAFKERTRAWSVQMRKVKEDLGMNLRLNGTQASRKRLEELKLETEEKIDQCIAEGNAWGGPWRNGRGYDGLLPWQKKTPNNGKRKGDIGDRSTKKKTASTGGWAPANASGGGSDSATGGGWGAQGGAEG